MQPLRPPATEPAGENRRLFRRYPAGLGAELVVAGATAPCRISDISLGGAGIELDSAASPPPTGVEARLRSPDIAAGLELPAEVRQVLGRRVHLAFRLDAGEDFELTMSLIDSPATLDTLVARAE